MGATQTPASAPHVADITQLASAGHAPTLPRFGEKDEVTTTSHPSGVKLAMAQIIRYMRDGRNLGPLSVLLIVALYSLLLSPHLPAPIHDYIYHIAH